MTTNKMTYDELVEQRKKELWDRCTGFTIKFKSNLDNEQKQDFLNDKDLESNIQRHINLISTDYEQYVVARKCAFIINDFKNYENKVLPEDENYIVMPRIRKTYPMFTTLTEYLEYHPEECVKPMDPNPDSIFKFKHIY